VYQVQHFEVVPLTVCVGAAAVEVHDETALLVVVADVVVELPAEQVTFATVVPLTAPTQ